MNAGTKVDVDEITDFLRESIMELVDVEADDLVPDAVLEDLGLISLDYVEIHVLTKRRYGVGLTLELFVSGQVKTLGELASYIAEQAPQAELDAQAAE